MGCSMASQQVHPTAIVHANAQIGKDVEIGPYAIIEEHVVIGDRCRIDAHAVIKDYTRMGVGNHIHSHALVGGEPQDLKFQGEVTWLELGDDNRIREFATLHRGTEGGGGITRIGSRNLCMAYTHIAHASSAMISSYPTEPLSAGMYAWTTLRSSAAFPQCTSSAMSVPTLSWAA